MTLSTKRRQLIFAWRGLGAAMVLIGVADIAIAVLGFFFVVGSLWMVAVALIGVLFIMAGMERWQHAGDLKRRRVATPS